MKNPPPEILRQAWHRVAVVLGPVLFELPNLRLQGFTQGLVGVNGENPFVTGSLGGSVLLLRETLPRVLDYTGAQTFRDLRRAVG
jgi:hypothetical protein